MTRDEFIDLLQNIKDNSPLARTIDIDWNNKVVEFMEHIFEQDFGVDISTASKEEVQEVVIESDLTFVDTNNNSNYAYEVDEEQSLAINSNVHATLEVETKPCYIVIKHENNDIESSISHRPIALFDDLEDVKAFLNTENIVRTENFALYDQNDNEYNVYTVRLNTEYTEVPVDITTLLY